MRRIPVLLGLMNWMVLGCDARNPNCTSPGTPHDENIEISASQFPSETAACFSPPHDCSALCGELVRARGTGGRVIVTTCERAGQDDGSAMPDGPADAAPGVSRSVHVIYRTYPFCGT